MIEQAIQMALLRGPIYLKMQDVFRMYEEGKLKGQRVRNMTGVTLQKALEGKLAPKLHQYKVFQGLQVCIIYFNIIIIRLNHHDVYIGQQERRATEWLA